VSFRLLEAIHGHFGILAAAALVHPAILLRRGKPLPRRTMMLVALTTLAVAAAFLTGLVIYGGYLEHVRPGLFIRSATAGLLFETKEHLAYAVVATTLGAGTCAILAPREGNDLRRAAAVFYAVAAGLCLLTAALGTWVASVRGFR
jgi:hypothetical protein